MWATQQLVGALVFAKINIRAKCGEPSNWFSAAPLKFDPSVAAFSTVFPNIEKWRLEVTDVISDVTVE